MPAGLRVLEVFFFFLSSASHRRSASPVWVFPWSPQRRPEPLSGPERAQAGWRYDLQPILSGHLSLAANPAYQQSSLYQEQPH